MLITIAVIVVFQSFWLHKNFVEEERVFTLHSNMLFRETIFKLQASKLHLDTNIKIRMPDKTGLMSMSNVLQEDIRGADGDHIGRKSSIVVSIDHSKPGEVIDTVKRVYFNNTMPDNKIFIARKMQGDSNVFVRNKDKVYDFLIGVDSLQDSISLKEIDQSYKQALVRENISTPFSIQTSTKERDEIGPVDPAGGEVTVGFSKPKTYQLQFANLSWFITKRLFPQIIFSLLLIGVTIFSFLLLFRNWQQQKKLTAVKNDFIGNITHELKTPIATVSVAIEALKNFNALQDPRRTQEYLDISANELQRLSLLVDKVLKLSMFEKDQIDLNNEKFDIKLLIEEVVGSMRLQFEKYNASINLETEGTNFIIHADKLHITSVVFNLLDNALKYSKANPSIQIRLKEDSTQLQLTVTDNGIGIPAGYKDKIFDKFFRVPTGDKHNVKGYGLGLSYIAYVLKRQGGSIQVESKEGIGSCFSIIIPKENE